MVKGPMRINNHDVTRLVSEPGLAQDPTARTVEALARDISYVKELFESKLSSMEQAVDLLQSNADKSPTISVVHEDLLGFKSLLDERFKSVETQFRERDIRVEQTSKDGKTAVDAALQAQKEAVGKSEISFTKQIDQIGGLISTMEKSLNDKIDDVKTRLTVFDGRIKGVGDSWGWIVGIVGMLAGAIPVIILLLNR